MNRGVVDDVVVGQGGSMMGRYRAQQRVECGMKVMMQADKEIRTYTVASTLEISNVDLSRRGL